MKKTTKEIKKDKKLWATMKQAYAELIHRCQDIELAETRDDVADLKRSFAWWTTVVALVLLPAKSRPTARGRRRRSTPRSVAK